MKSDAVTCNLYMHTIKRFFSFFGCIVNITGDADSSLRILQSLQSSLTSLGKWVDHNFKCLIIVPISIPRTNILQYSMKMEQSSHPLLLLEVFCIAAVVLAKPAVSFIHNPVCLPAYKNTDIYPAFSFVSKLEGMEINWNHPIRYVLKIHRSALLCDYFVSQSGIWTCQNLNTAQIRIAMPHS